MRRFTRIIVSIIAAAVVVLNINAPVYAAESQQIIVQRVGNEQAEFQQMLDEINAERAKAGAPALTLDATLCKDAQIRASECTVLFDHTRPDGSTWYSLDPDHMLGENLAMNCTTDNVVDAWMASPSHRENILNPEYKTVGFGMNAETDDLFIAQEFGY